jgi:hypothetical protein
MLDFAPDDAGIAQDDVVFDADHVLGVPFLGQRPRPRVVARAIVKPDPDQRQNLPAQMLRQRGIGAVDLDAHPFHPFVRAQGRSWTMKIKDCRPSVNRLAEVTGLTARSEQPGCPDRSGQGIQGIKAVRWVSERARKS